MRKFLKATNGSYGIFFFIGLFFFGVTYLQGLKPWGLLIPLSALGILISIAYTIYEMQKIKKSVSKVFFFTDLMQDDNMPFPIIRASVSFLSTKEGGRKIAAGRWYKPNHNFGPADGREFYVGEITFGPEQKINPGETGEVTIRFLPGPGLREKLKPGQTWRIQEGGKLVAMGKVLEVVNKT